MGEYYEGSIRNFKPDDDEKTKYIDADYMEFSFSELIEIAKEKWGDDIDLDKLEISPDYIHTRCLGYDLYDPMDYDKYLVMTYQKN